MCEGRGISGVGLQTIREGRGVGVMQGRMKKGTVTSRMDGTRSYTLTMRMSKKQLPTDYISSGIASYPYCYYMLTPHIWWQVAVQVAERLRKWAVSTLMDTLTRGLRNHDAALSILMLFPQDHANGKQTRKHRRRPPFLIYSLSNNQKRTNQ